MIDRGSRDQMLDAIERYRREEIPAPTFDNVLSAIFRATKDRTVRYVANQLWDLLDNPEEDGIVTTKDAWDVVARLELVLQSDASVKEERHWHWGLRQLAAIACLVIFLSWVNLNDGEDSQGWIFLALWSSSVALSVWNRRVRRSRDKRLAPLVPFASVAELRRIRRSVTSFRKMHFPTNGEGREIRGGLPRVILLALLYLFWFTLTPYALLVQALPEIEIQTNVVMT